MRRRIIVDVDLPDDEPGGPLQLLTKLAERLDGLITDGVISDYGLTIAGWDVRLVEPKRGKK